jgi:hypothetical protein
MVRAGTVRKYTRDAPNLVQKVRGESNSGFGTRTGSDERTDSTHRAARPSARLSRQQVERVSVVVCMNQKEA